MSAITTHVLDTARGRPAARVEVLLELDDCGSWRELARSATDADGRAGSLLPPDHRLAPGTYRLRFAVAAYLAGAGTPGFYPRVTVEFEVGDPDQHYHVPLLLSPYGYSTYRGS